MAAMREPWSGQQREWLQALGHDVLVLASADAAAPDYAVHRDVSVEAAVAKPRPVPAREIPASALLRALARAAGCGEHDADFLRALPDLATLRGNPAARRALWPRLRALRRQKRR